MPGSAATDWLSEPVIEIVPAGPAKGVLQAPSSKSLTNRLLVMAALAEGKSVLSRLLVSDDTVAMTAGLRALGVRIERLGAEAEVTGTSGRFFADGASLDAGLSGTTLRFLAAVALLVKGTVVLDGEEALRRRPMAPLLEALRAAGAVVSSEEGRPPLRITGHGLGGGLLRVDASASSQFATALLLVGPYADDDLVLEVAGLKEPGYVRLTVDAMRRWGACVTEEAPDRFKVSAEARYLARAESVEHDASAAAHLFALALATGGAVTVTNAFETAQPDGRLLEVLAAMGASFVRGPAGTTVERLGELTGLEVDLGAMPDQLPTLAALGALARGDTVIRGTAIARGHESDRIHAVATELRRLGARVEEAPDGLSIHGGAPLHGGRVETYRDHRIAMAFTAIGAAVPGVEIADPGCVAKTYPGFFNDVLCLGVGLR
ncbi:MAG: 3-phosphoshikimate 1-carboxyvinyltransferase [Acidimicrobiales bacterium]|jgi:3-phosphoshikimate 1-carboxyvinyltransferase